MSVRAIDDMTSEEQQHEARLMLAALNVSINLVDEFGYALNPRAQIDVCLRLISTAILSSENPPEIELARIARELPEIIERQRPGYEASHAAERSRGN